jgi:hypothetical protein
MEEMKVKVREYGWIEQIKSLAIALSRVGGG